MQLPAVIGAAEVGLDDLDSPFWHGLAQEQLRIQQCAGCEAWTWAPQWRCGPCGSWEMHWPIVEPTGRVYSWTRTWHPVAAVVAEAVPYVTVLVELPQAGLVRVLGLWLDNDDPELGEPVQVEWPREGEPRENSKALCWRSSAKATP